MAEEDQAAPDITITVKGPSELKLSITISPSKNVIDLKEAIAEKSDVEKDRQRLIYSGKVLKDEDTISQYKIQNGHTIHMVKGGVKPASQPSTSAAAGAAAAPRLPQMGTGINPAANPIEGIENVHHGLAGFNPFAQMQGMGNLNDPNAMAEMMNSDAFLQQMADMMARPEVVDQMIASNPQLAPMRDQIRATMSNPMFRQMMSNPQTLRMIMQMQSQMGQNGGGMGGMGGLGGMGGMGGFPGMFGAPPAGGNAAGGEGQAPTEPFPNLFAPQAPSTTPSTGAGAGAVTGGGAGAGAAGQTPANPFAGLFGGPFGGMGGMGAGAGAGAAAGGEAGNQNAPAFNPWMFNPGMFGGGFPPSPAAPRDTRPPEEIYATQLGQLNDMGLWDAQKNIRALRSTGGNVQAAIELIFSGQLDGPGGQ